MKKLGTLGFSIESSMMSAQTPFRQDLDGNPLGFYEPERKKRKTPQNTSWGPKSIPRRSKIKQARKQKHRK